MPSASCASWPGGYAGPGPPAPLVIRADSGFWAAKVIDACRAHRIGFSISVRSGDARIAAAIQGVPKDAWHPIDYTRGGLAEVAETTYRGMRLVIRRTRLVGAQAELFPDWRHHAFLTDRPGSATTLRCRSSRPCGDRAGDP